MPSRELPSAVSLPNVSPDFGDDGGEDGLSGGARGRARRRGGKDKNSSTQPLLGGGSDVLTPRGPLTSEKDNAEKALRRLRIACVLCFLFMGAEVAGGYYANSLAIMTDAAHLLSDVAGLLIRCVFVLLDVLEFAMRGRFAVCTYR